MVSLEEAEVKIHRARGFKPVMSFLQQATAAGKEQALTHPPPQPLATHMLPKFDLHQNNCPACITEPSYLLDSQSSLQLNKKRVSTEKKVLSQGTTLAGCAVENQRKREKGSRKWYGRRQTFCPKLESLKRNWKSGSLQPSRCPWKPVKDQSRNKNEPETTSQNQTNRAIFMASETN